MHVFNFLAIVNFQIILRSVKYFKKIFELQIKLYPSLETAKSSRKLSAFLNFSSVSVKL